LNVKYHLKKIEALCKLEDRVFPQPVDAPLILIRGVVSIEFMLYGVANIKYKGFFICYTSGISKREFVELIV
jgi:hypothetical protein